jgi:hypothetical protein
METLAKTSNVSDLENGMVSGRRSEQSTSQQETTRVLPRLESQEKSKTELQLDTSLAQARLRAKSLLLVGLASASGLLINQSSQKNISSQENTNISQAENVQNITINEQIKIQEEVNRQLEDQHLTNEAFRLLFSLEGATSSKNIAQFKEQGGEKFLTSQGGVTSDEAVSWLMKMGKIKDMSPEEWQEIRKSGDSKARRVADGYKKLFEGKEEIIYGVYKEKFIEPLMKQNLPKEVFLARVASMVNIGENGEPAMWKEVKTRFLENNLLRNETDLRTLTPEQVKRLLDSYFQAQKGYYKRNSKRVHQEGLFSRANITEAFVSPPNKKRTELLASNNITARYYNLKSETLKDGIRIVSPEKESSKAQAKFGIGEPSFIEKRIDGIE